jgi:hypothetical protein
LGLVERSFKMGFKKLVVPTVHLNGSGKASLQLGLECAVKGITEAIESLRDTAPHGRDYYVQKDERALARAQNQYVDRLMRLEDIKVELEAGWQGIEDNVQEVEVETWNPMEFR